MNLFEGNGMEMMNRERERERVGEINERAYIMLNGDTH